MKKIHRVERKILFDHTASHGRIMFRFKLSSQKTALVKARVCPPCIKHKYVVLMQMLSLIIKAMPDIPKLLLGKHEKKKQAQQLIIKSI